jgi:putative peptidoglycan lipid II flippase
MSLTFSKQSIGQASILIAVFTIISQALGLFRESLIANFLGTSAEYDIILVALAIPSMIGAILMTALSSAAIPLLQNGNDNQSGKNSIIRSQLFRINLWTGLSLTVIVMLGLPFMGKLLGSGLNSESVNLVLKYGYLFCLIIPIRALEATFQSFLHVRYHFTFPAISTIAFNIVIIGMLVVLFPTLGPRIYVVAIILGVFMEMALIGIPAYFIYRWSNSPFHGTSFSIPEYFRLFGIIGLVEAIGLLVDPFDRYLAGIYLTPGYVSANYYAGLTGQLPIKIVVMSLGVAIFPSFSKMAAEDNRIQLSGLYHRALAICIMLILPITAFSICFRNDIITFLFERGRFDAQSRILTSSVFFYYAISMVFSSVYFIQSRLLISLKVWGIFLWTRIAGLMAKAIFGIMLIKLNWALAIGGGTLIMSMISMIMIEYSLNTKLNIRHTPASLLIIIKAISGGIIMIPIIILLGYLFRNLFGLHSLLLLIVSGFTMFIFLFIIDNKLGITGIDIRKLFGSLFSK